MRSRFHPFKSYRGIILAMTFVCLCTCAALPVRANGAHQAVQPGGVVDSDGDVDELLYHWQDVRFYNEERHQIVMSSLLIAAVTIGGRYQRSRKRK